MSRAPAPTPGPVLRLERAAACAPDGTIALATGRGDVLLYRLVTA
jgi:hypothetical protein